ncbi:MAG TPA: GDP-mannose 4,6-dehydratase [Acidimicrobiia bacterium]|nr:GDP-mannose 4,6-dehydratase [Acidimicrobiia bacterium]
MKMLVTGAAGFLGSNLTWRLLTEGHEVVGVDDLSMGREVNIASFTDDARFTFVAGDISHMGPAELGLDFDRVVHLAAKKIPRYGGVLDTLHTNYRGTLAMLELAREAGAKFVFSSTSDIYGRNPELPFNEYGTDSVIGSSKAARWAYAISKLFDEHMVLGYHEEHGLEVTILRYFGSYGPNQHPSWWGGPQSVFIDLLLEGGKPLPIHGDGSQTRTFTYVEDTVEGTYRAIVDDAANGEILNIGSTFETNILDLARLIGELMGVEPDIEFVPYESFTGKPYQDVMRRVPDTRHARDVLGFEAKIDLREGLRRTIEWRRGQLGA